MSAARPYRSNDHLADVVDTGKGRIEVRPQSADRITFDVAKANSMPANLPESSYNGSSVLDIGHGIEVRLSGYLTLTDDGWKVPEPWRTLYGSVYPSGRELTGPMRERATTAIEAAVNDWAATHAGDIAQADDIERSNGARTLEEAIAKHQTALKILRAELRKCEAGKAYRLYPELPTKGR